MGRFEGHTRRMTTDSLYFDYNATTPLDPLVREAMSAFLDEGPGNPSSLHAYGQRVRLAIAKARGQVARLVGARPDEIVFTSGGTEADNMAVFGAARREGAACRRIVTTAFEHQAVLNPCRHLAGQGYAVEFLPADAEGRLELARFAEAVREPAVLAAVMLANNDTGAVQPVAEAAALARACGALFLADAVQAVGKIPVDVSALGVDLLSFSAHKLHGPAGVGALYVRKGCGLPPLLFGGHQEKGLRPGTENAVGIVGFGKACELAARRLDEDARRVAALRDRFEAALAERVPGVSVNARGAARLPNTSNLRFEGVAGDALVMNLDLLGLAVSGGSACSASDREPSHVLLAMGQTREQAREAVRFSIGCETTEEEIGEAVARVAHAVGEMRRRGHVGA